jgi:predicted PurR-regulated permease PerM
VFGVAAVLVLGVVGSIVPRVVVEARDLAGRIPGYASTAQTNLQKWINEPPASLIPLLPKSIQDRLPSRLRGELSAEGTNAAVAGGVEITPHPATAATVPVTNMGSLSPGGDQSCRCVG